MARLCNPDLMPTHRCTCTVDKGGRRMLRMNNWSVSFIDFPWKWKVKRGLLEAPLKSLFLSKSCEGAGSLWATNFYNEQLRLLDLNILGLLVNTPKSELSLKSSLQDWSNYFSLYGAQQHRVALFCTLLMHFLLFYSYASGHEVSHLSHLLQFLVTESVYFSQIP